MQSDSLEIDDAHVLREITGELDAHLKWVATDLGCEITRRGGSIRFSSPDGRHHMAIRLFQQLAELARGGMALHPSDVRDALRILRSEPEAEVASFFRDAVLMDIRKRPIVARTANQRSYLAALRAHDVVFGIGPAGTGKTYLAIASAVAALRKGRVRRIVLTRPAVEAGEKLGFLPGDLTQKVDPYLRPLFDALTDMMERSDLDRMMERGDIEVAPLAFMRGRTLNEAVVILDEAQNTTVEQMKMFLTRLGDKGRMIITGDPSQIDLPDKQRSGLEHALNVLKDVPQIGMVRMTTADVVRHPIVAAILDAYQVDADAARERMHAQTEANRRR